MGIVLALAWLVNGGSLSHLLTRKVNPVSVVRTITFLHISGVISARYSQMKYTTPTAHLLSNRLRSNNKARQCLPGDVF